MARASKDSSRPRTSSHSVKARDVYMSFNFDRIVELLPKTKMTHIYGSHIRRKQVSMILTRALCFMVDDMIDYDDWYKFDMPLYKNKLSVEEHEIKSPAFVSKFYGRECSMESDQWYLAVTLRTESRSGKIKRTRVTLKRAERDRLEARRLNSPKMDSQEIKLDRYTQYLYDEFPGFTIEDIKYIVRFGMYKLGDAMKHNVPIDIRSDYFEFRTYVVDRRLGMSARRRFYSGQKRRDAWLYYELAKSTANDIEIRALKDINNTAYVYMPRERFEEEIVPQLGNDFIMFQDVEFHRNPDQVLDKYKRADGVKMAIHGFTFEASRSSYPMTYFEAYEKDIEIIDDNNI